MGLFKLNSIYWDELWAVISSIDFTVFFLIFFLIIFKPLFPCRITIFYFGLSLLKICFTSVLHLNIKGSCRSWEKLNFKSRIPRNWYISGLWKLVSPLIRCGSFESPSMKREKIIPFSFDENFFSRGASSSATSLKSVRTDSVVRGFLSGTYFENQ